ncbi:MAG: 23S rRNA (uracil(1939)-C(5))-methyltransferase RlmD [Succinivibrionaceae bacterium]|nr:23S rRNA (uracil(1939)-C(5))-methyltransferase RlmD [Succinivibrionaceae bacterium]
MRFATQAELIIESVNDKGYGVSSFNGKRVFVDGAIAGECVVAELAEHPTYYESRLVRVVASSPFRAESNCGSPDCGGCQLAHIAYRRQLQLKTERLASCLARLSVDLSQFDLSCRPSDAISGYRNKSVYYVRQINGSPAIGMFAKKSHRLVPVAACLLEPNWITEANARMSVWMKLSGLTGYDESTLKGDVREIIYRTGHGTGEKMAVLVATGRLEDERRELVRIAEELNLDSLYVNVNASAGNGVYGAEFELIYGKETIATNLGRYKFRIGPRSFWQLNSYQCENLYDAVRRYADLAGNEVVFDLYCGVGSIGLSLDGGFRKLYGVEIVPEAVELARFNAELNGIENTEFRTGRSEDVCIELVAEGLRPDVVILDPPRKGCHAELLDSVARCRPSKIVYVSCDPESLSRDLACLVESGEYRVRQISAFDLFPNTCHVETVVLLSRDKA